MTDQTDAYDINFYQLAFSLHSAAMQHMGKTISQLSGKIERNLDMAKNSIDMLEMLQKKTDGNLTDDEKKMLDHFLFDLRMNYVEEVKKEDAPADPKPTEAAKTEAESEPVAEEKKDDPPADESEK
ncbi:MAG: DUF1844 domain-containing protein [bacterium]|nr:DUF1844 domain-containing protein [bacterium]